MEWSGARQRSTLVGFFGAMAMVATTVAPVAASVCTSLEFKVAGKHAKQSAACYAKAIRKGVSIDAECISKSYNRFQARWAKAEAKGDCLTAADANQTGGVVGGIFLAGLTSFFGPVGSSPPSVCTAVKYKAAARAAVRQTKCWAKAVRNDVPVDAECLAKAEARLLSKFAKADQAGDCLTTGDAGDGIGVVTAFMVSLESLLVPPPPSPTPTATPSGPNCCDLGGGACLNSHTASNYICAQLGGMPSAVGEVCDAATGTCLLPPSSPGNCCQSSPSGCIAGPAVTASTCGQISGTLHLNSLCIVDQCVDP